MLKVSANALAVVFFASFVLAQAMPENPPPSKVPPQVPGAPEASNATGGMTSQVAIRLQQHLAACLLLGSQQEMVLGQLAAKRVQNDDVRRFAQSMVEDHKKAVAMLARFAPRSFIEAMRIKYQGVPRSRVSKADQPPVILVAQPAPETKPYANARTAAGQYLTMVLLAIEQQATDNNIELTRNEWQEKQGVQFDKAYVGQQIVAHINMLAHLKAVEPYASAQLGQIIRQAEKETVQHLDRANKIMKSLEGGGSTSR